MVFEAFGQSFEMDADQLSGHAAGDPAAEAGPDQQSDHQPGTGAHAGSVTEPERDR